MYVLRGDEVLTVLYDNMLIIGSDIKSILTVFEKLKGIFEVLGLGEISKLLGLTKRDEETGSFELS